MTEKNKNQFIIDSGVTENLSKIAQQYKTNLEPIVSQMNLIQSSLPDLSHFNGIADFIQNSSIGQTAEMLRNVTENLHSITHFDPDLIRLPDYSYVIETNSNEDVETENYLSNTEAYNFLYELETFLRKFIIDKLLEGKELEQIISNELIEIWKGRKRKEEEISLSESSYHLIEYSDFNDLKAIFEKRTNKKILKDFFNEQRIDSVISKLNELDPIRKKIAHSRKLTEEEITRIKLYSKDILQILK